MSGEQSKAILSLFRARQVLWLHPLFRRYFLSIIVSMRSAIDLEFQHQQQQRKTRNKITFFLVGVRHCDDPNCFLSSFLSIFFVATNK